jgi:hypothetical protein
MSRNDEAVNDVRRKIGEVMKKDDNRLVFGWRPEEVQRKEGDVWVDAYGKTWTVKKGIKQTVTKLDSAKMPFWCPKCNSPLNHAIHTRAFNKFGYCYNCIVKKESELKQTGEYKDVLREKHKQNTIAYLKDKIQEYKDYHENITQPEFIHADNEKILMIEKWNVDLTTVKQDLLDEIQRMEEHLLKIESGEFDETS